MGIRVETTAKRVRVLLGGRVAADSTRMRLVWEHPYYPTYFFPVDDVVATLTETGPAEATDHLGECQAMAITLDGMHRDRAARRYDAPDGALDGLVAFDWAAMDAWFEEDEQVYVHARDPHARVDVLDSSRHVRVSVDGVTVADSHHPKLLFETGLPTRHYLPKADVRMDLLTPSETRSECPYKGVASWWSVTVDGTTHADLAWEYPFPVPESAKIAGLVCFYDEKVDVDVDGRPKDRPRTHFA